MSEGSVVELSEPGSWDAASVSAAWPENVFWNGESVFKIFYEGNGQEEAWSLLKVEGYGDGQEAYLGYDPQSDAFIMGFDAFLDEGEDEYYDDDDDDPDGFGGPGGGPQEGLMDGVLVELFVSSDGSVVAEGIIEVAPGGMYPAGLKLAKRMVPQLVDIRLA